MESQDPQQQTPEDQEPVQSPQPLPRSKIKSAMGLALGLVAATGGAFFLLVQATTSRTLGATRSCRLQWQERQAEVDAAIAREDAEASQAR